MQKDQNIRYQFKITHLYFSFYSAIDCVKLKGPDLIRQSVSGKLKNL